MRHLWIDTQDVKTPDKQTTTFDTYDGVKLKCSNLVERRTNDEQHLNFKIKQM